MGRWAWLHEQSKKRIRTLGFRRRKAEGAAMAYTVMAYIVMANTVMACIVMADIVMAYVAIACIVMAYKVIAYTIMPI